ncbi:MAG: hypothetical protein ACFFC3_09525, partial [Candidatus Odinarchaeota archaeon]
MQKFKKKSISINLKFFLKNTHTPSLIRLIRIILISYLILSSIILLENNFSWNRINNKKKNIDNSQSKAHSYALEWFKEYNYHNIETLAIDNKSNIYFAGGSRDTPSLGGYYEPRPWSNMYIIKCKANGTKIWNKTFGGSEFEIAKGLVIDSLYNIYVIVASFSTGMIFADTIDTYLIKYSSISNIQFELICNEIMYATTIGLDSTEKISLMGINNNPITGENAIAKYDNLGNVIEKKILKDIDWFIIDSTFDSYNNLYFIGSSFLIKLEYNGNQLWNVTINNPQEIEIDSQNNVCVLSSDALTKYDSNGNQQWISNGGGISMDLDSNDNIYILNESNIVKYDNEGNILWNIEIEDGKLIEIDIKDNIYIGGKSNGNVFLKKYGIDSDSDGLSDWQEVNLYYTNPNVED